MSEAAGFSRLSRGAIMKKIVATCVALAVAAAVVAPMAAEARSKKKKRVYHQPYAAERYSAPRNEVYQEFIADKRPVGTSSWWEQMDREGRGGQSRAN
jgi:hypothetical protein